MRLQWPRFLSKPEPDRAKELCTARIDSTGHMTSVLTGVSSTLDTAYTKKVSSLAATRDTRWRAWTGGLFGNIRGSTGRGGTDGTGGCRVSGSGRPEKDGDGEGSGKGKR
ncbi:hypothetical protein TIFTF001_021946 [Ficus carica]|uniref:Uncharacterized protein n=1 Tax=Ficus carica TaxID=3494 RepID=A0AA88AIZ9_FICCA|nr:hypothetical protein TIFTF001_021946 [Ficus carica]